VIGSYFNDAKGTRCEQFRDEADLGSVISGTIANGNMGGVVIPKDGRVASTAMKFEINGATDNFVRYEKKLAGKPVLISEDLYDISDDRISSARVSLMEGYATLFTTTHAIDAIRAGSLITFADSDADRLTDSWETIYGLNPQDPIDANGDLDGDFLTNVEEFVSATNPASAADRGWWSDSVFRLPRAGTDVLSDGSTEHTIAVSIPQEKNRIAAKRYSFTVSLTGDATFSFSNLDDLGVSSFVAEYADEIVGETTCDITDPMNQSVSCEASTDKDCWFERDAGTSTQYCNTNLLLPRTFKINAPTGAEFSVSGTLKRGANELNELNNTANLSIN